MTLVLWVLLPCIEAEHDSTTGTTSSLTALPSDDNTTSTNPVATANDEHSMETMVDKATSMRSTKVLKKTSTYKAAYIAALDQANSTPKPTVLAREQSCHYKAKYEAALARADASTTSLWMWIAQYFYSGEILWRKAASWASIDKPSPCVKQHAST